VKPDSKPPFDKQCRAKLYFPDFSICLNNKKSNCQFALHFGFGLLCKHPLHKEIVARTIADDEAANK